MKIDRVKKLPQFLCKIYKVNKEILTKLICNSICNHIIGHIVSLLKSSQSIKIDLVQSSICRIKLVLYLPSEYYPHRLQQNNQANGQRDFTLRVPKNSCLFLYCDWLDWLRIIILANISIEKVRHFIFLSWSGPGVKSRTLT